MGRGKTEIFQKKVEKNLELNKKCVSLQPVSEKETENTKLLQKVSECGGNAGKESEFIDLLGKITR